MDDFKFQSDGFGFEDDPEIKAEEPKKKEKRRTTVCKELSLQYEYRRAYSETKLLDCDVKFKKDSSYNFITGGDVDQLSFLKLVLRHIKKLDYCLFSTWCMAAEDVLQLRQWVENGTIKKLDAYVGEIFPSSYKVEWLMLQEMYEELNCGRIAVFKNHSKIFAGKKGEFYFGIQTSANINTNPRTENACITINKGIYDFYKEYFDGIEGFKK